MNWDVQGIWGYLVRKLRDFQVSRGVFMGGWRLGCIGLGVSVENPSP